MSADYLMRQIETLTRFLAQVVLHRRPDAVEVIREDGSFSRGGFLQYRVRKLLAEGDVNGAENLLFEAIEADPADEYLPVALDFYEALGAMDAAGLAAADFTRQEIVEGLEQVKRVYGV